MIASAFSVCFCGAKPVFVDCDRETWNINPDLIANAIILILGIMVLVVVVSLKGLVSSMMLKQLFMFFAVMMATYLIVKVIAIVIGFFKGDLSFTGGSE